MKYKYLFFGILISTLAYSGFIKTGIVSTANADTNNKRCVWTFITDGGEPELGEDGKVEMDENWTKMSNEGWSLKGHNNQYWIFEKCN